MAQAQPAQAQLPTVGTVTRCPRCGAPAAQFNRWPATTAIWRIGCSACDFTWQEASAYSSADTVKDSTTTVIASLAMALVVMGVLFFVYVVFLLLRDLFGADQPKAIELGATLLIAFAALLIIAAIKYRSPGPEV